MNTVTKATALLEAAERLATRAEDALEREGEHALENGALEEAEAYGYAATEAGAARQALEDAGAAAASVSACTISTMETTPEAIKGDANANKEMNPDGEAILQKARAVEDALREAIREAKASRTIQVARATATLHEAAGLAKAAVKQLMQAHREWAGE